MVILHLSEMKNSTNHLLQRVYTKLILPNIKDLPLTEDEGLRRICDEHKYTFITPFNTPLSRYSKLKCEMLEIPRASFPGTLTMPMSKNHPFLGLFNYNLRQLRSSGVLKRLQDLSWPRKVGDLSAPWKSVNIEEVMPMFFQLGVGIIAAMFFLVIEFVVYAFKFKNRQRINTQTKMIKSKVSRINYKTSNPGLYLLRCFPMFDEFSVTVLRILRMTT
ncbi:hypothetical protein ANN_12306, partial [Periplaneta americana]